MKVQKGLATYAGLVAALGQYMAAIAVFLDADDQSVALGPLVTATVTLLAVIVGRMQQAKALAVSGQLKQTLTDLTAGRITSSSGASNVSWGTASYAATTKPGEFDREPTVIPKDEQRELPDCA